MEQPRFRAGFDFMRLRADAGEVDVVLADWWQEFSQASDAVREDLVAQLREEQHKGQRRVARRAWRKPASAVVTAPQQEAGQRWRRSAQPDRVQPLVRRRRPEAPPPPAQARAAQAAGRRRPSPAPAGRRRDAAWSLMREPSPLMWRSAPTSAMPVHAVQGALAELGALPQTQLVRGILRSTARPRWMPAARTTSTRWRRSRPALSAPDLLAALQRPGSKPPDASDPPAMRRARSTSTCCCSGWPRRERDS